MLARAEPPPTPIAASGWAGADLPSGRSFFIRGAAGGGYSYFPAAPRLARDAAGRPRVALTLVLGRSPVLSDASLAPLVMSGSLALVCSLAADIEEARALEQQLGAPCLPWFARGGAMSLRDDTAVYVRADILGADAQCWLGVSLPPAAALAVLYALDGAPSRLRIFTEFSGQEALALPVMALESLLGGALDGLDRSRYLSMVVVNADGTATPVPPLHSGSGGGARGAPVAAPLMTEGERVVSLPFAMTPSHAVQPSAAALAAGGAVGTGAVVNAHAQSWIAHDAIAAANDGSGDATPDTHLPFAANPAAPYWLDALDKTIAWYAPAFELVTPAARDDPAIAAFSFVYSRMGAAVGPGGTAQVGLTASVKLTVRQVIAPETVAALAQNKALKPQPVPLHNLSCALEIPYRRSGSSDVLTQRFPGTALQQGDQIAVTVALLDDWVRLAYSALAYAPMVGVPPPRIVVDYAFLSYAYVNIGGTDIPGGGVVVGGGIHHQMVAVEAASELPVRISSPTLVRRDLMVVGPDWSLRYQREAPGAQQVRANVPPSATATAVVRPPFVSAFIPRRVLVTRSVVREETVDAPLACASFGDFYLQRSDGGSVIAIGCQDALKLGETTLRAFDEIPALRDPAFRIYRSLQQPGRFLLLPARYRVGRYGADSGDKAFRPMIVLYGVLSSDPAQDRYALTATLTPDAPPTALAKLTERLAAYVPAGGALVIVYPTDPFVAAKVSYAWAVPNGLDAPQAITVLDAVSVTLSLKLAEAALLTAMMDHDGVQGSISFLLPDGTALPAALSIDNSVIGPPDTGPVTVAVQGGAATLQNRTKQAMNVTDVVTVTARGATQTAPVNLTLAPGATAPVSVNASATLAFADAQPAAPSTLEELDVFVEDVTATVTFINQINFANHQLSALGVQARLKNDDHAAAVDLPEGKTADISFTMPITAYLARQTLHYALVETKAGAAVTGPWRDWDLNNGMVIGITADQL